MANRNIAYGTETAITATNINSLANNEAKVVGGASIDNSSTKAIDYKLYVEVTLNSTGVSASGSLEVYLIESTESTTADFSDGIDPTSASNIAASLKNARLLDVLNANANNQVVKAVIDITGDLAGRIRNCPKYWAPIVLNKTGAAINSSGNEMTQTAITETIA